MEALQARLDAEARTQTTQTASTTAGAQPPDARQGGDLEVLGIVGIVVGAVGLAAGGAALGTGLTADDHYQSLERSCGPTGSTCPAGSQRTIDEGSALATASTALTITSLVAVAAGATLLAIDLTDGSGRSAEVAVGPGDVGLSVRWRL
jgi:hypothetical protein